MMQVRLFTGIFEEEMMIKKLIKSLAFLLVLSVVLSLTFRVLWIRDNVYSKEVFRDFYGLPENSTDVVFIGASGIKEYYIVPEAFHHNGISSYALATGNQPFGAAKYVIQEAEKTQDPEVYVVDIRMLIYDEYDEGAIRRIADPMKFSKTRTALIDDLLDYYEECNPELEVNRMDYYFSYSTYHSRWEESVSCGSIY